RHREGAAHRPQHPSVGNPHRGRAATAGVRVAHHHGGGAGRRGGAALNETPYAGLTPDLVLDAVAACGLWPDGRLLALNSYENRVWQVGIEDAAPVIAKFYRPGRWSDAAILEEHAYARELADDEVPMVAPLVFAGRSLREHGGYRYALSPRRGGRAPTLESREQLEWLGRLLARLHATGARKAFANRGVLDRATLIAQPVRRCWPPTSCPHICTPPTATQRNGSTPRWPRASMPWAPYARCACTATVIPATSCGPMPARTSSTSTMRARVPRCRTCGCSPATTWRCARYWTATPSCAISIPPNSRWYPHCARCASCTTRAGSPSAGTIPPSPPRSRSRPRRAGGTSTSPTCTSWPTRSKRDGMVAGGAVVTKIRVTHWLVRATCMALGLGAVLGIIIGIDALG